MPRAPRAALLSLNHVALLPRWMGSRGGPGWSVTPAPAAHSPAPGGAQSTLWPGWEPFLRLPAPPPRSGSRGQEHPSLEVPEARGQTKAGVLLPAAPLCPNTHAPPSPPAGFLVQPSTGPPHTAPFSDDKGCERSLNLCDSPRPSHPRRPWAGSLLGPRI